MISVYVPHNKKLIFLLHSTIFSFAYDFVQPLMNFIKDKLTELKKYKIET